MASGFQMPKNWEKADREIADAKDSDEARLMEVLQWWWDRLAQQFNDPEGHLVIGWLVRHGALEDPEAKTVAERLAVVRAGGWDVPGWMDEPIAAPQGNTYYGDPLA
jgi:hypothetical protein